MPQHSSLPQTHRPPERIGRYALVRPLGAGGMASVYLANDPVFARPVAIKLIHAYLCEDPAMRERFRRESVTLSMLKHPAVVPVHEAGEEDGQPYLAMQLMEGGSLQRRLGAGPVPASEAAGILLRVAPALDAAHAMGIIHRDVKPGNILFDREGRAYLSDFGLVRLLGSGSEITRREFFGTPAYAAPEQAAGLDADGRADVYALAAVFYRMLAGALPFDAPSPQEVLRRQREDPVPRLRARLPYAPESLQTALDRAMAKRPEDRFPSAAAFAQACAQALEGADGMADIPYSTNAAKAVPAREIPRTEPATRKDAEPPSAQSNPMDATATAWPEESLSERSMKLSLGPRPGIDRPVAAKPQAADPHPPEIPSAEFTPAALPSLPRSIRTGLIWLLGAAALAGLLALAYAGMR